MANIAPELEMQSPLSEDLDQISPETLVQMLTNFDDTTLGATLTPLAGRLAESPEIAAQFIDSIIKEAINLGIDLSPTLGVLLEQRLMQVKLPNNSIEEILNELAQNQDDLIQFFKQLDVEVQRQMGALYIYLQINRGISVDDYFQIAKKLNLPKLPRQLWDVRRFGVSNMGKMNSEVPANLDYTPDIREA